MTDARLDAALAMAREAGALAQRMRADPTALGTRIKGPMDLVTAADTAAEDLIRKRILALNPDAAVLGEESGLKGDGGNGECWIVDPIDGTVNFFRGSPDWAVSIACYKAGALDLGVIHAPDLGLTAWAARGQGSFLNGAPVCLTDARNASPLVVLGTSGRSALGDYLMRIERLLDAGFEHRRYGAATICFLGVLGGWVDAFQEPALNIWDAASGILLVQEAGGIVHHDPLERFVARPSAVLARNPAYPELDGLLF